MSQITIKKVRKLFLTKEGVPKKEKLLSTKGTFKELGLEIPNDRHKRHYDMHMMNSVFSEIRKYFREHNCNFIRCIIEHKGKKTLFRGFTKNEEKILNSISRDKKKRNSAAIAYKESKRLADSQMQITFEFDD